MASTAATKRPPRKRKKVTDVLVGFVIDRSGSMTHLSAATVDGFNTFLDEQRANTDGNLHLSLLLFDDQHEVRYVAEPVDQVTPMSLGPEGPNGYFTRGSTALYDATAVMVEGLDAWLTAHPSFTGKVLVAVLTDGAENASRRTSLAQLNALIGDRTARGWQFAFLGTGGSAWLEGQRSFAPTIGAVNAASSPATAHGTHVNYATVSAMTNSTRTYGVTPTTADAYQQASGGQTSGFVIPDTLKWDQSTAQGAKDLLSGGEDLTAQ